MKVTTGDCLQHHRLRLDFILKMSIIDYYRDELLSQAEKFKYPEVLLRLIAAVSASPVHCGKVRAEHKNKAIDLPVNLHPHPYLWSRALDSDQKIRRYSE